MSGIGRKVRGGLLAASVLGALGFGAAEAFARPAEDEAARRCNPTGCSRSCEARLGPLAVGFCLENDCVCLL